MKCSFLCYCLCYFSEMIINLGLQTQSSEGPDLFSLRGGGLDHIMLPRNIENKLEAIQAIDRGGKPKGTNKCKNNSEYLILRLFG